MFKFAHKKHAAKYKNSSKIVIYYSFSDILLGLILIVLVMFFCFYYISVNHALR